MSLHEALRYIGRPDLVKEGSDGSSDYSFESKDATLVSYLKAIVKNASEAERIKCEQHARFWQITDKCHTAAEKLAQYTEQGLDDNGYALVESVNGESIKKYASFDKESTANAAVAFHHNRARYPLEWRKKVATELLRRADKYEATIPQYVETYLHKAAGFGFSSPEMAETMLVERLNCSPKNSTPEATRKLAEAMNCMIGKPELCLDTDFVKTAVSAIDEYDTQMNLTNKYDSMLSLPEELYDSRFTTDKLEKIAGFSRNIVKLINGTTVDATTLTKEALAAVSPTLASMNSDELIGVLPTLPLEDADLLTRLI
jgi:hypothetical protein